MAAYAVPRSRLLSAGIPFTRLHSSVSLPRFPPTAPRSDAPLPSTGSPRAEFPGFLGTIRALRLPDAPPAALRLPSPGGTTRARFLRSRKAQARRPTGQGLLAGPLPALSSGNVRTSHVPGEPPVPMPCSPSPAGSTMPGPCGMPTRPPLCPRRRLPHWYFRGSITRPGHSLSTLRRTDRSATTQDSRQELYMVSLELSVRIVHFVSFWVELGHGTSEDNAALSRKTDVVEPPVRFYEREVETEHGMRAIERQPGKPPE
jgi:hypothetical protein